MNESQGEIFRRSEIFFEVINEQAELKISSSQINKWQRRIFNYQKRIFESDFENENQTSLLGLKKNSFFSNLNILELSMLPINFWKSNEVFHDGPSIYFVVEKLPEKDSNIILYIGETISANQRWKGEHDCKSYIDNYQESLFNAGMKSSISIRFTLEAPTNTKERRQIEQQLIQLWLPPFNKETRHRWATPYV